MKRPLFFRGILCGMLLLATLSTMQGAKITVTTVSDLIGGSLRAAISAAAAGDTIEFSSGITDGIPIVLTGGEITIDKSLTITGNGILQTLIVGSGSRIFNISNSATVALSGLVLSNGQTTLDGGAILSTNSKLWLDNCMFLMNEADGSGGAIYHDGDSLFVSDCQFMNNTAHGAAATQGGGAIYQVNGVAMIDNNTVIRQNMADGASGSGGGIFAGMTSTVMVADSRIVSNTAMRAGGGIEDNSGAATTLSLMNVALDSNMTSMAPGNGGGLHITGAGNATITGGTAMFNEAAAEGGALWNGNGMMTVSGMLIEGNVASGAGADQGGGGIYNLGGTLIVEASTIIRGNIADGASGSGGGILNDVGATLTVEDSWIVSNTSMRAGGGIEDVSGSATVLTLTNVMLDSNMTSMAPGNGGGLHVTGDGDVMISGGSASHNMASAEGGGLWNGAGMMTVDGVMIEGNTASGASADQGGGGIYNLSGTVMVEGNTVIRGNMADGASGSGGGILNDVGATLTVESSWIVSNTSMRAGGGIEDVSGSATVLTLTNVMLDSNMTSMAPGNGGGLHVTGDGDVMITGGTASHNMASAEGGALWNGAGMMTVDGVMIEGNTASGASADQGGGGIYNLSGTVMVEGNTVIRGNMADGASGSGGGILNDVGATLTVEDSWIVSNTSMRAGGGIEDVSGSATVLTLTNVMLDSNMTSMAPGNGGGLHVTGDGDVMITGGTASHNMASAEGGALWNGAGMMTVDGVMIEDNIASGASADQGGGGIYNLSGTVMVQGNTVIRGNMADGASGSGGGILNDVGATLTVEDSWIVSNTSMRAGGGIEDNSGSATMVTLMNVAMDSNSTAMSPGNGGAFHITGDGGASIMGGTVIANSAGNQGGGLWNGSGMMTIEGVSIEGNMVTGDAATSGGGGVYNKGGMIEIMMTTIADNMCSGTDAVGGGVFNTGTGMVTISYSTISSNSVNGMGGGITSEGGLMLTAVTIASNMGGAMGGGVLLTRADASATLSSSLVADNSATMDADVSASMGTYVSDGYNLIGQDGADVFAAMATDLEGTMASPIDPMLGMLADNGGPTRTHALMSGSPAIDAGDPQNDANDQRDSMVVNGQRDMGAFEFQGAATAIFSELEERYNRVYPNPANGANLEIEVDSRFGTRADVSIVELASGKVLLETRVEGARQSLHIGDLPAGVYLVQFVDDQRVESHRLVVSR